MTRPPHGFTYMDTPSPSGSALFFFFFFFLLLAMPTFSFLCASLRRSKLKQQKKESTPADAASSPDDGKLVSTVGSISGRALAAAAEVFSWKRGEPEEEAVWKKAILMGEKCRELEFSGRILYDLEGNRVEEIPRRSPRHGSGSAADLTHV